MSDIIDTIDALIEEQLAEGETPCGSKFPSCPHCDRDWHGFPLTERVADMYCYGLFDEDYRVVEDDSPVLCPGSDHYGPARPDAVCRITPEAFSRELLDCLGLADEGFIVFNLSVGCE